MIAALVVSAVVLAGPQGPDEAGLRAAVQRFYDAQAAKDLAATVASWSPAAPDRPSNGTYQAIFDTGEDQFAVDIRELVIVGSGARLRIMVSRVRSAHEDGGIKVYRGAALNNQEWRYEGGAWKLVRDRSAADDFADVLFAANDDQWPGLLAKEPDLVNQALRYAVAARASGRALAQQYREALNGFRLARAVSRALNDRGAEIEALQNIASAYYFLKDFTNAAETYTSALSLAREADAQEQVASAQMGLGTVAYSRGDYSAALAVYDAARLTYEARDEGTSVGRAVVSIGNVQYLQGEYDAAAGSYRRALDLLTAGKDFPDASLARSGLGRVFATQGDLSSALQVYTEVLADTLARPTPGQRAATLESIGEIHYRLGNVDDARARFGEAARFYALVPLATADVARIYGDLGLTELSAGRADAALAAYTSSRDQYARAKRPDGVAHAWVGIGFSHAAARRFDEAIAAYRTAITMLDEQQRAEDSARAWLGLCMAQRGGGDRDAALDSARHVRAAADALNNDELRWRAAVEEGTTLRALGRLDDARAALEGAIAIVERMAAGAATSAEVRGALDGSGAAWAELAFTLAQAQDAPGALLAAERRHAHLRRLMLAPFERDITTGMTASEQRDEQQDARDIVSTRAQLRAERAAPHPDAARVSRLEDDLSRLTAQRGARQAALYARLPDLQMWRAATLPADLEAVAVSAGTAMVEYIVGDDDLLVTWLARGPDGLVPGASVVQITRQALSEAVDKAIEPAALKDTEVWRVRSAPLSDALLAPVRAVLDGRDTCVIVPDDLLWRVPFEALPIDGRDLASRLVVAYAASLVTSARHAASPAGTAAGSLAVIAPTLAPAIRDTEAAAREAIGAAALTTIVAPVEMSGAAPLFSSILLAPSGDALASDGRLEVREWFGLRSAGGLVVLPDARSFDRKGIAAAMEALDWATAAAGVQALFVGRAPAGAFAIDGLSRALQARLARGERPGAAWHGAIADVRATAGSAPAAWAGLRLVGSPR